MFTVVNIPQMKLPFFSITTSQTCYKTVKQAIYVFMREQSYQKERYATA